MKDAHEVLIPINERKKLIEILHSTHMSGDAMFRMAKGSFTWPNLKSDLGNKYKNCEECLVNSRQKIDKPDQIPEDLTALFPGEQLSVDYAEILGKNIFLIVDRVSSHVFGRITPDKSFNSAKQVLEDYMHTYTLPYQVQSDN